MSLTGWTGDGTVKQPHRSQSKGIGGPGGPLRGNIARIEETLDVWGLRSNPYTVGMSNPREFLALKPLFERLSRNPNVQKQFSTTARCTACWERGNRKPRRVNGRKLCLVHEWLRGERLLGTWVSGTTYATVRTERSL